MKKTIANVIASFNLVELKKKYDEMHRVGTPRLFVEGIKAMMEDAKNGKIAVKGMAKKHQVADKEVVRVYLAHTIAYDYALPHRGDEVPTTVLMMVTLDDTVYYWDYFTNQIGVSQEELSIKAVEFGWKSWIMADEMGEDSGYYDVEYTPRGTTATAIITIFAADESTAKSTFTAINGSWGEWKTVTAVTKIEAIKRSLNF